MTILADHQCLAPQFHQPYRPIRRTFLALVAVLEVSQFADMVYLNFFS